MLDRIIINEENKQRFLILILISFVISLVLASINYFIGGNSLFLVALISLALAYPITRSARRLEREEIDKLQTAKNIFQKYKKELIMYWSLFIGITIGLYIASPFVNDFSYQKNFIDSITGFITNVQSSFLAILINNLEVAIFTFIISFLIYSALIFVIVWNASILTYYFLSLGSTKQALIYASLMLAHALLEIGGYVFAGIAGALLAFRLDFAYSSLYYKTYENGRIVKKKDRRKTFQKLINKHLILDLVYLLILSVLFITTGAIIEVM